MKTESDYGGYSQHSAIIFCLVRAEYEIHIDILLLCYSLHPQLQSIVHGSLLVLHKEIEGTNINADDGISYTNNIIRIQHVTNQNNSIVLLYELRVHGVYEKNESFQHFCFCEKVRDFLWRPQLCRNY